MALTLLTLVLIVSLWRFISLLLLARRRTLSCNIVTDSLNRVSLTMKNSLLSRTILKDCGCWCCSWAIFYLTWYTSMRFPWYISTWNCLRRIHTSINPMNGTTIHAAIHKQRLLKSYQRKLLLERFSYALNSDWRLTIHHIQIICSILLKKRRWSKITWSNCSRSCGTTSINF